MEHLAKELSLPRQEEDGSEAQKKLMEARRKMTTPTMIPPASTPEAHREEGRRRAGSLHPSPAVSLTSLSFPSLSLSHLHFPLFTFVDILYVVVSPSSPAALSGGEDLAISDLNGGRLCSDGGALGHSHFLRRQIAVVDDKCPRSRFGGVDFESQAVVVILYWQLSLQVGVVLLVDRRRPCQTCELGLSSSSWLNQKWRFSEAGWLSFSLRLRVMLRFSGPVARAGSGGCCGLSAGASELQEGEALKDPK
ncbi:hypothetical protein YC2023_077609 [Brassica napus]